MTAHARALWYANAAAVLFGGTALFAKLIGLPALEITFWRSLVALVAVWVVGRWCGADFALGRPRAYLWQLGLGMLLGLHWWTYFRSIQESNVAVGLVSLFTAPVITVFFESALHRRVPPPVDIALGAAVFLGVWWLVPELSWRDACARGAAYGVLSALLLSVRSVLHPRLAEGRNSNVLTFYQVAGICLLLLLPVAVRPVALGVRDGALLVVLGVLFTALPHGLIVAALGAISAKTMLLVNSMMVVYGVLFAWLLLGEKPRPNTLLGGGVILLAATVENLRARSARNPG